MDKSLIKQQILYYLLCAVLLVITLIGPVATIFNNRQSLLERNYSDYYKSLRNLYYSSQYVKKINPGIIPDQALEAFAGGIFLTGLNPILIVHDQPPLGRYIIALSIKLFDNAGTLIVPLLLISLVGIFLIGRLVLNSALMALIPVAIFANEPLFLSKFSVTPLLEGIQLPFIVFALFFFIKGVEDRKNYLRWFVPTSLTLGFVISIRFFVVGAGILGAMLLFFILQNKYDKKFFLFLLSLPLSLVVLVLSYLRTLQSGYSLPHIFGIQKYILLYQKSKFILPFSFWDLLFFNKWHTWWGTRAISSDQNWIIAWPIATVLTLILLVVTLFRKVKLNNAEKIIFLWLGVGSTMLSVGYTSTRYFLPLLPFLYIMATAFLKRIAVKFLQ